MKINHFDFGLANGQEIKFCYDIYKKLNIPFNIYGFDAEKNSIKYCNKIYNKFDNIQIIHAAISNQNTEFIKLYLQNDGGKKSVKQGNSIYSTKDNVGEKFQLVKNIKFSKWIKENNINLNNAINIVRINIEGAEWDFFTDIEETGIINKIKIFMGTGTDIDKVKELRENNIENKFQQLLKRNNIIIHRYSFSSSYRNIFYQDFLSKLFPEFENKLQVKKIQINPQIIKENENLHISWEINNIEDNQILLVLLGEDNKYLSKISYIDKNINNYIWKTNKYNYNNRNKFKILLWVNDNYPNNLQCSDVFEIL